MIPINMPISPTLLVRKAFFDALAALSFSNQNPIRRYELSPTNSQNIYIITRLSANTIPFIENVKIPKNAKYREYLGSPFIYSTEYKCTKNEIRATTNNIIAATLLIRNPKSTLNFPVVNH